MTLDHVETICICGAGTMGRGIALVAALSGFRTKLYDVQQVMLWKSKEEIDKSLQLLQSKNKITEHDVDSVHRRLMYTHNIDDCKADIVIEAIVEKPAVKLALFQQLATVNNALCIFASNTSSLSISDLQAQIVHPERFAGMHFFNPATHMKLVEVVKGKQTAQHVVDALYNLAKTMGKVPVHCNDAPGFIVNHIARPYYLEAMRLVESGAASMEQVDAVMEATGFKMGPFKLMDFIGLDINYSVSEIVWEALGKPERLTPAAMQKAKVDAGELGRKTGKGFYEY
ncbi:MAG: 3-hydroxybutyryl-CoA dehydrogenase [Bacteroidetes bacterium]|uniref:3-hydroxyacyl-CoA dehydrogenase family protein n=1 Tax=Phnomibacter sp. TaxID=2836217 RepID=UPI002FDD7256|nr:3-hydroxybutyryl-CoA dehydrogenase [Bacteroidota bacterium]